MQSNIPLGRIAEGDDIVKVINAIHNFREVLSNLAYDASSIAVVQDQLNNLRGSSTISNTIKKYTYTPEPKVIGPDFPIGINVTSAETAKNDLNDAHNKLGACVKVIDVKVNELFTNWKAGKNRAKLLGNFTTLSSTIRKYNNESIKNVLENLEEAIKLFKFASEGAPSQARAQADADTLLREQQKNMPDALK